MLLAQLLAKLLFSSKSTKFSVNIFNKSPAVVFLIFPTLTYPCFANICLYVSFSGAVTSLVSSVYVSVVAVVVVVVFTEFSPFSNESK